MRWGPFMKILVFVDGSEHSIYAVETAAKIAKDMQASVTLLAIAPHYSDSEWVRSYGEKLEEESNIALKKAEELMREKGINPGILLLKDVTLLNAKDEVVDIIKERGFDLAIIGSQGLTGLKKFILGGIDVALIDGAPCSVLAVRSPLEE
jgi:nucleotide-binding universal stress UspA family protein